MKFRTFIDDSTESGQNTLSGISTQGTTYGVGITSDVDGVRYFESTGIATVSDLRVGSGITVNSGIVTATGGFISGVSTDGLLGVSTTPIHITLEGNVLSFAAVGIGSTHFTLYKP